MNVDFDDEGDYIMSNIDVTKSELEIDDILNQMMNNLEGGVMVTGNVIASTVRTGLVVSLKPFQRRTII